MVEDLPLFAMKPYQGALILCYPKHQPLYLIQPINEFNMVVDSS